MSYGREDVITSPIGQRGWWGGGGGGDWKFEVTHEKPRGADRVLCSDMPDIESDTAPKHITSGGTCPKCRKLSKS